MSSVIYKSELGGETDVRVSGIGGNGELSTLATV